MRNLISIDDLSDEELRAIVAQGATFRAQAPRHERLLDGVVVGSYFRRTSTRTRTAFASGALRLGAQVIAFGPDDLQLNTGETAEDTGRVLGGMLDTLVARTTGTPAELRALAGQGRMSVINAMSAAEHPTQALADLTTMLCRFGRLEGLSVLYVGEGNNTAAALALAMTRFEGTRLELRTPPGYGLDPELAARARTQAERHAATLVERHDMDGLPEDLDLVYTTRWQTTGTSKPDPGWREVFGPFHVGQRLWDGDADPLFMHDLPAHRGDEVSAEVLDGPRSIAFEQAQNKMYSAMAVLAWCHGALEAEPLTAVLHR